MHCYAVQHRIFAAQSILQVQFIFIFLGLMMVQVLPAQVPATPVATDSVVTPVVQPKPYSRFIDTLQAGHRYLNATGTPLSFVAKPHTATNNGWLFYLLTGVLLFLALLRAFYSRYFTNLFRVFFNTSLRQGQLTDQLLQAKLPSLLFNVFFLVSAGFFVYLLLAQQQMLPKIGWWLAVPLCIALLGVVYGIKYLVLWFTGWITSYKAATDNYIFIVFLINKIVGVLLVPLVIMMAFVRPDLAQGAAVAGLMLLALMLLLRFFKSYGLLQGQIKVSRLHFFLYITGIEILPLLLIYKALVIYLNKNL